MDELIRREEKAKAIDVLKISAPVMAVTQEEFNDYIQTLNKIIDWLEQTPMRDATPEEQKSVDNYIKSISKPTGVKFDEGQEQLDFVQPHNKIPVTLTVGDAISRQAAIDAFGLSEKTRKYGGDHSGYETIMLYEVQEIIDGLPSVSTEKTGRWIHYEGMLICSECGAEFYDDIMEYCGDDVPKCCPNCGAKMEVEE